MTKRGKWPTRRARRTSGRSLRSTISSRPRPSSQSSSSRAAISGSRCSSSATSTRGSIPTPACRRRGGPARPRPGAGRSATSARTSSALRRIWSGRSRRWRRSTVSRSRTARHREAEPGMRAKAGDGAPRDARSRTTISSRRWCSSGMEPWARSGHRASRRAGSSASTGKCGGPRGASLSRTNGPTSSMSSGCATRRTTADSRPSSADRRRRGSRRASSASTMAGAASGIST